MSLPTDSKARKSTPITTGVLDYFPDAIAEVARVSKVGNDQHNPGEPLHWAREKSTDHADCIARHLLERGKVDSDGQRHSAKLAWRALALLQTEIEAAAANVPPIEAQRMLYPNYHLLTRDVASHKFDTACNNPPLCIPDTGQKCGGDL